MEAMITANTARSCRTVSLKANCAIKIATVKPIPAALPVAITEEFDAPVGKSQTLALVATKTAAKTPNGLPTTSPKKIPQEIGERHTWLTISEEIATPVFAKAKSGIITKLLQGCTLASSHSIIDSDPSSASLIRLLCLALFGVNKPRTTPASVGCTPLR